MSVFYYCCLSVVVRTLDKPCIVAYIMLHFMLLHSLILLICSTLPVLRPWPVLPPQSREWGELLPLCVSRLRGFVWFFPLHRDEERRTSSYDPRGWGHLPKELFASCPSVKYGWHRPPGLRRLGADSSVVLLPRLLTPRRGNPRVEWMLSHFYECFSVHSFYGDTGRVARHRHPFEYYAIILWTLTPVWHRPGCPPQSPGYCYYHYYCYYGIIIHAYKYYVVVVICLCCLNHVGNWNKNLTKKITTSLD